jgi:hypothetical protein
MRLLNYETSLISIQKLLLTPPNCLQILQIDENNFCVRWKDRIRNYNFYGILQFEISQSFRVFFFGKNYLWRKIWAENIRFQKLSFELGFFKYQLQQLYFHIVSDNQLQNYAKRFNFFTCWRNESNIYSHIQGFYTHLSSNNR